MKLTSNPQLVSAESRNCFSNILLFLLFFTGYFAFLLKDFQPIFQRCVIHLVDILINALEVLFVT